MKKAISLLLALVLCLSLCACGGGNDTPKTTPNAENNTTQNIKENEALEIGKEILGEWYSVKSIAIITLTFNEDGTGVHNQEGTETTFTWKYDEELNCYTIALGAVISAKVENVDGVEQLIMGDSYCVRAEYYDEAHQAYMAEQEAYLAEQNINAMKDVIRAEIEGKTLAQFNNPYKMSDNVEITIAGWEVGTHNIRGTDCAGIWLTVEVKNLTDSDIKWTELPIVEGDMWLIHGNSITQGSCIFYEYFNTDDSGTLVGTIPANETVKCLVNVAGNSYDDFDASVDTFGYVMGFISFTFDGIEYYLDLADIQIVK